MSPTPAKRVARHLSNLAEHHPPPAADGSRGPVSIVDRVELSDGRLAAFELVLGNGERFVVQVSRIPH